MTSAHAARGACVFLGTSDFAIPTLQALVASGEDVGLVVTQPDRPKGRGNKPVPSPVKAAASALSLPVLQPESVNSPEALASLRAASPDFLVVVAYGQLLRRPLLEIPRLGAVNLHASLLPRHRGASPIAWAIWQGDERVGNTTMLIDEGLDSGPILLQESLPLAPELTRGDLEAELSRQGAALLVETLRQLRAGNLVAVPQAHDEATLSRLLTRDMRALDWGEGAVALRRQIHALSPSPAALVRVRGRLVKILRAAVAEEPAAGQLGQVTAVGKGGPVVACSDGGLVLVEVQPEGKRPMSGADFARGGGVVPGDLLERPDDA